MSAPYTIAAIFALWVVGALLVALVVGRAIKRADREPDAPEPTIEMELAANWRVIRALDCTYDALCEWESTLLDDESPEVSSVIIARRVITDLRDMKAAL